jgi:hypothetical protein
MGETTNAYKVFAGKLEGKRPLRRPRHRWEDNIKMDLKKQDEMVCTGFIWLMTKTSGTQ